MASSVLFAGWNRANVGREAQAAKLFQDFIAFYGAAQKEGRIESFEPVFLSAHGGDLNGFVLIRGEGAKLDALRRDEKFTDLIIRATVTLQGFGVVPGYVGEGVTSILKRWTAAAAST